MSSGTRKLAVGSRLTRSQLSTAYNKLLRLWASSPPKLNLCTELLRAVKEFAFKTTFATGSQAKVKPIDAMWARDILEIAAQVSIANGDMDAFSRYVAILEIYYFDCPRHSLRLSAVRNLLLGLRLLCLKVEKKHKEFRALEQRLTEQDLQSFYIKAPVALEEYASLGVKDLPSADGAITRQQGFMHKIYMNLLVKVLQDEIAKNIEKSYASISILGAADMLYFNSVNDLKTFAKRRKWCLDSDGKFTFQGIVGATEPKPEAVPAVELANQFLTYHAEMENIV